MPQSDPSVAVALLAAGSSRRFGGDKLSAELGGRPLWRWAADACEQVEFDRRLLIVRDRSDIGTFDAGWEIIVNPHANEGIASSIRLAAQHADGMDRLVIMPADMPLVAPGHLRALATGSGAMFTGHEGRAIGAPAAFPASEFARLGELSGDRGAAALEWPNHQVVYPGDSASLRDIDTPAELAEVQSRVAST